MQREILNVAKACQLPGFRYVRFTPQPIVGRQRPAKPEPDAHAEAQSEQPVPAPHEQPVPIMVAAAALAPPMPAVPEPVAAVAQTVAPPPVPVETAVETAVEAAPATPEPLRTAQPAMRQFALLTEMTHALASRTKAEPMPRSPRGWPQETPPLPPLAINRSLRGKGMSRPVPDQPASTAPQPPERALLAEVTATLQRRRQAGAASADAPQAADRTRPSRTL